MLKKAIIFSIISGFLYIIANISYNDADKRVQCHYRAKIIEVGSCIDNAGIKCAIRYKREDSKTSDYANIKGLVMKGQTAYQNCYNDGKSQMCYADLKRTLDTDYSHYCPSTKRFNDFYNGKEENITLLTAFIDFVLE